MARGSSGFERPPVWAVIVMIVGVAATAVMLLMVKHPQPVYSPPPAAATTSAPALAALKVPRPPSGPLRVLFAGDSITHGAYSTSSQTAFPALMLARLAGGDQVTESTAGRAGETTDIALAEGVGKTGPANVVIVEFGTNDVDKGTAAVFGQAYPALLGQLMAASPGASLECLGPWGSPAKAAPFEDIARAACTAHGGRFVALSPLYGDQSLHATIGNPPSAVDNFHPNDAGHRRIARLALVPFGLQL